MLLRNISIAFLLFAGASCTKELVLADGVYPTPEAAEVKFSVEKPIPASSDVGGTVRFGVAGLADKTFTFYINDALTEVMSVTNTTVTVKVPQNAFTGNASVKMGDKTFYGPVLKINGSIAIDANFSISGSRTNGVTNGLVASPTGYYLFGEFSDFNNKASTIVPIRGVVNVDANGNYAAKQYPMSSVFEGGGVNVMLPIPNNRFLVAGEFNSFFYDNADNSLDRRFDNINGLVRVHSTGLLDSAVVDIINLQPDLNHDGDKDTVSAFNGGVTVGGLVKSFLGSDGKYVTVGNFYKYTTVFYPFSTSSSFYNDEIIAPANIRMNADGSFDSSYNYDFAQKRGGEGATGFILDAIMLPNNDIVVVGNFSSIHGVNKKYIAKLNRINGKVDVAFNPAGEGPNGDVNAITYNSTTGKILIAGTFTTYNGIAVNGAAMLNPDGSLDPVFKFKPIVGGVVNYAKQIAYKNMIVVSGSFSHYNEVARPGILFLDGEGNPIPQYNRTGLFSGKLTNIVQVPNANTGYPSLFLMGKFNRFDNAETGNFLKINFLE